MLKADLWHGKNLATLAIMGNHHYADNDASWALFGFVHRDMGTELTL